MSNWAFVCLSEILTESKIIDNCPDPDRKIRVKLNCNGVEKRPLMSEKEGATKNYVRKSGQFIYGKQNFHKGAFGVIPTELDGFSSSGDLPAFDVDSRCLPEWIYYWFKTDNRYLQLAKHAKGVGSQRVNVDSFLKEEIALPSLNLQAKIIGNINNSSFTLKSLSVESQNQSSYLTKLRQAILQEAIEGKLTADWRKENPVRKGDPDFDAEALLEKIKDFWKNNSISTRGLKNGQINEAFSSIPSWIFTNIDSVGIVKVGGTPSRANPQYWGKEIPWVSSGEVANCEISITNEMISKSGSENSAAKLLPKGTVLVAMIGQGKTRGQTAILNIDATTNQNVCGIVIDHNFINPKFLFYYFLERYEESRSFASGGNQSALNGQKIGNFNLPLPPLAEQQAIVERVEKLLSMVDELEKQVSERKEQSEQLMQAVLREAFEGGK